MNSETDFQIKTEIVDAANQIGAPLINALEKMLRLAARAVDSNEASIIVPDFETGDLKFLAAIGEVADRLRTISIPGGKGIAGFVFASGQPLAVADAKQDQNFYSEIDRQTGYSTQTILATPLRVENEIIGVLEFVNRRGEPPFAPFASREMDTAAVYAEAIAALVDAYAATKMLESFGGAIDVQTDLKLLLKTVRASDNHREMLEFAVLVREIVSLGEAEKQLCRDVLKSFMRYAKTNTSAESFLNS